MLQKMIKRFYASDDNAKELICDLVNIGQKVDTHAVLIKHLEFQMAQFTTIVNPCQSGNLHRNTIQNPKMMEIV